MKRAVACNPAYPSSKMRAYPLRDKLGWDFLDARGKIKESYDAIYLIKGGFSDRQLLVIRTKCGRLVYDPLDALCFERHRDPFKHWNLLLDRTMCDDVVASTPAQLTTIKACVGTVYTLHLIPHQSDERIDPSWHDPKGHVTYCGSQGFLTPEFESRISTACRMIGRGWEPNFGCNSGWQGLKGAALNLALRIKAGTAMMWTKPQVKIANAAAAGVPTLCTGHPCEETTYPGIPMLGVCREADASVLSQLFELAMRSAPPKPVYTVNEYIRDVQRVVESEESVIAKEWETSHVRCDC